jgi:hypothetical protein
MAFSRKGLGDPFDSTPASQGKVMEAKALDQWRRKNSGLRFLRARRANLLVYS